MTTSAPSPEAAASRLEFSIERERCIGCVACVNVFPKIFKMDGDRAAVYASVDIGEVPPSRVVNSCPVGAIRRAGAESEAKAAPALEIVPGWEQEWEAHRRDPEDLLERERRYGRVYEMHQIHGCFVLRIELARGLPNHELFYMHGIPMGPPEYDCTIQPVSPWTLSLRARLLEPRLVPLAGKLNSFPLGLKVDYRFPKPIAAAFHRMDLQDLWIYALPEGTGDPHATLAEIVREHLAEN